MQGCNTAQRETVLSDCRGNAADAFGSFSNFVVSVYVVDVRPCEQPSSYAEGWYGDLSDYGGGNIYHSLARFFDAIYLL